MAKKIKTNSDAQTQLMRSRLAAFMGYSHAGARDLYEVFGYSRAPAVQELFALYTRMGVANRIVRAFPQATWNKAPKLCDEAGSEVNKESDDYSPFAEAVDTFFEHHKVMRYLERADRVASIGRFGIMLMGFRDGKPLSEPVSSRKAPLMFLTPYCETSVQVHRYDENSKSERYGQPLTYQVQSGGDLLIPGGAGRIARKASQLVHWSRVIHISEFLEEDEVYGMPRLLPILNNLKDLEKIVGGAAELYWLNARGGLMLSADKDTMLDDTMVQTIKDQADEFQHQLRRYLVGQGMTATPIANDVAENDKTVDKLLDLIAGSVGIPKRILIGSERGELASSQDESNWSQRINERRETFATPMVLRPFIQRMIDTGNLPTPQGEWWVEWPDEGELGPQAAADIMTKKVDALVKYVSSPGTELLVPPTEFVRDMLGMTPHEDLDDDALVREDPALEDDVPEDGGEEDAPPKPVKKPALVKRKNATPRTAYVHRKVMNPKDIVRWARSQGFTDVLDDLHVTIAYSGVPFDWMNAGQSFDESMTFAAGGPRTLEIFGEGTAVIEFAAESLRWRHQSIMAAGGEHTYSNYKPHISFSKDFDIEVFKKAKPYTGTIVLGPELWEEIH